MNTHFDKVRNLFGCIFIFAILMAFPSCGGDDDNSYYVTAESGLNVRATPSSNGKVIGKLQHYDDIEVISIDNDWAKIKYKDKEAYVSAKFIEKNADLSFGTIVFFFILLVVLGGGGSAVVHRNKDGSLDRRFKANR